MRPASLLLVAAAVWTALVVGAPFLGGSAVYGAAALVCHQLPERSFHVAAGPLAVCARCLGIYAGVVAGLLVPVAWMALAGFRPADPDGVARRARLVCAMAAVPTLATLVAEWGLRWPIGNLARFVAALPLGAAAGWVVARAIEVDWRT